MITKGKIQQQNTIQYDWSKSFTSKFSYDLFISIGNCGYRIASYSIKTKRIIIHNPDIHIPQTQVLERFVELVNKKEMKDA